MNVPPPALPRWIAVSALLLIAFVFAANHIAARIAFDHGVNVPTAVIVRSAATAMVVWLLLRFSGASVRLPPQTLHRAIVIGLVITVQSYCLYSAVARIPVALALLAFNTFPFVLALISWLAGTDKPAPRVWIAMGVALVGLSLALDVAGTASLTAGQSNAGWAGRWQQIGSGVGFALGASFTFATALHLTTRWLTGIDGRLRSLVSMTVVAIVTLGATLGVGLVEAGSPGAAMAWPRDGTGWLGLILLTVFYGTAFTSVFVILPRIGAVNNAAVLNMEPIASLILAWLILGQRVATIQVIGAVVVVGAIIALATSRR